MQAILHTSEGDIHFELFEDTAPKTVANFVGLAQGSKAWQDPATGQSGQGPFYDGVIFHRVIDGFMIQTGDRLGTGTGGPGYQFDDEIVPTRTFTEPYLVAMANAGVRLGHGTNGSQFFITVSPTPHLNTAHTIFGRVTDAASRGVVDAIATTPVGRNDRPVQPITINSVEVLP
ncbi:MAG: peptidylprolyl isomerase [Bifidobacteriaceae bacterium]|jgi:peptidyl-prolyl cis-trans isomerase A (cyclophilin A)|nr:peptidylprolyl isomerase [Bifidobacteriaceae bacterium]